MKTAWIRTLGCVVIANLLLATSGCIIASTKDTIRCEKRPPCDCTRPVAVFTDKGLPKPCYFVGGGFDLQYKAPCDGTLYVVEETSRKIVVTRSLDKDDTYEQTFSMDDLQARETFGKRMSELDFNAYFIPAADLAGRSQASAKTQAGAGGCGG